MLRNFRKCWFGKIRNWFANTTTKAIKILPAFLFWFLSIEFFVLYPTKFYIDYYLILDVIDTVLFLLLSICILLDCVYYKQYKSLTESNTIYLIVLCLVLSLQFSYWIGLLQYETYFNLYKAIITSGILAIFISFVTKE